MQLSKTCHATALRKVDETGWTILSRAACSCCVTVFFALLLSSLANFSQKHGLCSRMVVSKNPIHELEVLPVLIACKEWGQHFSGSLVVYYVDNESARMAFVKGVGETAFASRMIHDFVCLESEMGHRVWFGRCPSYSNPSDSASRLDSVWFERRGVGQTVLDWERLRHHLGLDGVASDRR